MRDGSFFNLAETFATPKLRTARNCNYNSLRCNCYSFVAILITRCSFHSLIKRPFGRLSALLPSVQHLSSTIMRLITCFQKSHLATFPHTPKQPTSSMTLARMAPSYKSISSMKVQRSSAQCSSSASIPPRASTKTSELERPIDRYLDQDRDYKSYVSASYDPYQEAARLKHEIQLRGVVDGVKGLET